MTPRKIEVRNLKGFTKAHCHKDLANNEVKVYIRWIQLQKLLLLLFSPLSLPTVPIFSNSMVT